MVALWREVHTEYSLTPFSGGSRILKGDSAVQNVFDCARARERGRATHARMHREPRNPLDLPLPFKMTHWCTPTLWWLQTVVILIDDNCGLGGKFPIERPRLPSYRIPVCWGHTPHSQAIRWVSEVFLTHHEYNYCQKSVNIDSIIIMIPRIRQNYE